LLSTPLFSHFPSLDQQIVPDIRSTWPLREVFKGTGHLTCGRDLVGREGHFHREFGASLINSPAGMLLVDLVLKRPEHGATFSAHLILEPLV